MPVREFIESDCDSLRRVYLETRRQMFFWLDAESLHLSDFDKDTQGERIWVYELSEGIVGFVSIWEPEDFIHHLFVLPEYSGRGFGSQLLAACMATMNQPARLKCVSQNTHALTFYRSKGWHTLSKGIGPGGEYQLMQAKESEQGSE